jgi:hypothetical protein
MDYNKAHIPCGHWHKKGSSVRTVTCLGISGLSIDPNNHLVVGIGNGSGATSWEVVKVDDDTVMDSGSGNTANFTFTAELGTYYQLRFS